MSCLGLFELGLNIVTIFKLYSNHVPTIFMISKYDIISWGSGKKKKRIHSKAYHGKLNECINEGMSREPPPPHLPSPTLCILYRYIYIEICRGRKRERERERERETRDSLQI